MGHVAYSGSITEPYPWPEGRQTRLWSRFGGAGSPYRAWDRSVRNIQVGISQT